jgi:hypothetical protein
VSERLTHIGWDRGLLADVVDPLLAVELGIYPPPAKTTTARCGKAGRRAAGGPGPVRGAHPTSRDRDLDRALLGCGAAPLAGHCRDPVVLQPGCRCGTRPAIPPITDVATTAHHPAAHEGGMPSSHHPALAVPLWKGVHAMLDATLWQVDMGDGTWAVACQVCQQPLYRGAKAEADRVFDSHACEPTVPLTAPQRRLAGQGAKPWSRQGRTRPILSHPPAAREVNRWMLRRWRSSWSGRRTAAVRPPTAAGWNPTAAASTANPRGCWPSA